MQQFPLVYFYGRTGMAKMCKQKKLGPISINIIISLYKETDVILATNSKNSLGMSIGQIQKIH
jgi:hypothetical protein